MKVMAVGLGNMGISVMAAMLERGLCVRAVDIDRRKTDELRAGRSVVPEDGAEDIFRKALREGRLEVAESVEGVADCDVSFVGVQTPGEGLHCNYGALETVLSQLAAKAAPGHAIVVGSTVFPGAIRARILPIVARNPRLDFVYHPVFLRAGFGIRDYLRPGKAVYGVADPTQPPSRVAELAARILDDLQPRWVTYEESEWIKMVHNAFMSMKIAFANEISLLCADHPVDPERILDITLNETRYGRLLTRSHTRPGVPFSGPCLPKDCDILSGLVAGCSEAPALEGGLLDTIRSSNNKFRQRLVEQWLASANGDGKPLGIVGLSFRPEFNEMRHSLALDFIRAAQARGIEFLAYDPAFAGIGREQYLLACRQDKFLEGLYDRVTCSLDEVWSRCAGVFVNRKLDETERACIAATAPTPAVVDIYDNGVGSIAPSEVAGTR